LKIFFLIVIGFSAFVQAYGQDSEPRIKPYGMIRTGYHTITSDGRDGVVSKSNDMRLRLQLGLKFSLAKNVSINARFAGRFSTAQESFRFIISDHIIPGKDGLLLGESTIDELNFDYKPFNFLRIKAGRIQTKFELGGVPRKSLDRGDSPNTDVNWTDGIHFTFFAKQNWNLHFIAQHNSPNGSSNILRLPLNFEHRASRISYYAVWEGTKKDGFFSQKEISATYIPKSIPRVYPNEINKDLIALVTRLGTSPSLGEFANLFIGAEVGYVNNAPNKSLLKTGTIEDGTGGKLAYQTSVNLLDVLGKHNIGFVYGNIDDGWLISPDLRSNNIEKEIRHQWKITKKLSMENRIRWRKDKEQHINTLKKREDVDLYFRLTYRL
jgi:hypothetical protein